MSRCIVIDSGSDTLKFGYAGDSDPTAIPCVVGKPKFGGNSGAPYLGEEAMYKRGMLNLYRPVDSGIISDWDAMESLWRHAMFDKLGASRGESAVCLTEPSTNPQAVREKMAQIMFENFEVPALYIADAAAMVLKFANRSSGLVVDSGYTTTRIVPVQEGKVISEAIGRLDFGGAGLTGYLNTLTPSIGSTSAEVEILDDIKRKYCYLAQDFNQMVQQAAADPSSIEQKYELPDGANLTLTDSLFRCPEVFFQPSLMGKQGPNLTGEIISSIKKCPGSVQDSLYNNTLLAGGSGLFNGFADRLYSEIRSQAPGSVEVIPAQPFSAWRGASALASDSAIERMWVTMNDYAEVGPSVVNRMK